MTGNPSHVVSFDNGTVIPMSTRIDDPALVDVPYDSTSWRYFQSTETGAFAGIWEAGPHLERCRCDYHELCHILEGRVRLTDAEGTSREFGPGDSFVVASGFEGTWENLSTVRKVFFILR